MWQVKSYQRAESTSTEYVAPIPTLFKFEKVKALMMDNFFKHGFIKP
jgi:hypothetical protein